MDFVNSVKGKRIVVPLVFLGALVMLFLSETAYWRTRVAVDNLVSMGASRITILKVTEHLIYAESVQRAYVLTGTEILLQHLGQSLKVLNDTFVTLARDFSTDAEFILALGQMREKVTTRLALMERSVRLIGVADMRIPLK